MNSDDINDTDLDAFLKGEDALSRRLQALPQAEPSAALDAAVLARARAVVAPAAANDPAPLPRRWRVPAGLAAMLLVGVLAHRSFDAGGEMVPAPVAAPVAEPTPAAPMPAPPAAASQAPRQDSVPVAPAPPAKPAVREKRREPKSAALPRMMEVVPEQASALASSPAPLPVPAPAPPLPPLAAPPAQDLSAQGQPVLVTGQRASVQSSMRIQQAASSPAPVSLAPPMLAAPAVPDAGIAMRDANAERWLALIDEMLKAGLRSDALNEWARFRAAHPNYRVSAELTERINAARN